jgi:FAD/FMN-containing dehydrogenase
MARRLEPQALGRRPLRVLEGFGRAVRAASRYAAPESVEELQQLVRRAAEERLPVTFRGAGRSYGDAALNGRGLTLDLQRLDRALAWDPSTGILEAEPGLTIEGLWRRGLADGYWPHVVPGTMRPTLGGCLSMNVHGKNNFRAGPFGEHVLDFDLLTPMGELIRVSPTQRPDLFHAVQGGLGLLGAITRVRLGLHRVSSGLLRVTPLVGGSLDECFDLFEAHLADADYLVAWLDCAVPGEAAGRGVLHRADYLDADEDPLGPASFHAERQTLPDRILFMPKRHLWRFMRPFMTPLGVRLVNALKYYASLRAHAQPYLQAHVAFAFLLDYVPDWRLAYGDGGFIQYQLFVPDRAARRTLAEVLRRCQAKGLPSSLGVLKRHRPDAFLLSHAVDGWSLAMDFRVTPGNRADLWRLTEELTDLVVEAGGRFYLAKDAVLRPSDARRVFGEERLGRFFALKRALDPDGLLDSDLSRRLFGPTASL